MAYAFLGVPRRALTRSAHGEESIVSTVFEYLGEQWAAAISASWNWFALLNREEWVVVLAVCCAAGFLCMRGYGSRSNY